MNYLKNSAVLRMMFGGKSKIMESMKEILMRSKRWLEPFACSQRVQAFLLVG
ncbi:hypothetical protein HC928_19575 [bacterium]|nr:hypothetical protein [bacterium]